MSEQKPKDDLIAVVRNRLDNQFHRSAYAEGEEVTAFNSIEVARFLIETGLVTEETLWPKQEKGDK